MTAKRRKTIFAILRIGVCIAFVGWAFKGVTIYDRVTLNPAPGAADGATGHTLRLVAEGSDTVTVQMPSGKEETVPRSRVAHRADGEERIQHGLVSAMRQTDLRILALALLVFAPVPALQSLRLQMMLRAQEIHLSYWECVKLSFGGNFLNFAFPIGSTAGDVFKAYYTSLHTVRKTEAVTTILLDRIVGLSGLLVVAAVMSIFGTDAPLLKRLGLASGVMFVAVVIMALLCTWRRAVALVPRSLPWKVPAAAQIKRIYAAADRLVHHKPMVLGSLLVAVVLQFIAVGTGVMCARAVSMDFSGDKIWDYFAYIGSGHVVAAIPIAPYGLGTMEAAYKAFFLGTYGTLSQLLCLAFWVRVILLVWALPGALVTMLGAYRPRNFVIPEETPALD